MIGVAWRLDIVSGVGVMILALPFPRGTTFGSTNFALILLLMSLVSRSPGGYTEFFVAYLVFLEPWRRVGPIIAITTTYLISIPADLILSYLPDVHSASWLTQHAVTGRFGIALGQFARPFGLLLILLVLALDTIWQVALAHRRHFPSLGLVPSTRTAL